MIFLAFQVPHQCHREELNHPVSPAVAPLVHNSQDELCPAGDTDRSSGCLICFACHYWYNKSQGHGVLGDVEINHSN